ncbi:hypothetical protein CGRA01v4_09771 [Colletotrichum graminicola]|uniref:Uncharacterized protein n=1 Tax=Colletotrichum graminicola (strain M1.001 / M2 / FGSC 10212) TaxID=645133 RepID=E3QTI5_COLGM|nr:uncharacterized protein GLRG_09317 [Colletotrichum graminicola M1.001]EFQ34173.1 hypothetical protein GLRG_09317 [Colletotrichum graminicola M1.001]WDK18486.1 hypothetical protein CGRA01v4_09771 [Colletotrichum graminicola]
MAVSTNAEHQIIPRSQAEPKLAGVPVRIQTMAQKLWYNDSMPDEVAGGTVEYSDKKTPRAAPTIYDILLMPRDEPLLDNKVFVLVISVHAHLGSSVVSPRWD